MTTGIDPSSPHRAVSAPTTRDRVLDAAQRVFETEGWGTVTMSRVAGIVGVSRQTVHNELGTKHQLAQALAMRELDRFLEVVRTRMELETDVIAAVRAGCEGALELGQQSLLVRTIVTSVPAEQDADLLAILTTESGAIVEVASDVVKGELLRRFDVPLTDAELDIAVEAVVRLVLSFITRPSKPAREAAADIAWILQIALQGAQAS